MREIVKINTRSRSSVLKDGFNGNKEAMRDYRIVERYGLEGFRRNKPFDYETDLELKAREKAFRAKLRQEFEAPEVKPAPVDDIGAIAAAEMVAVEPAERYGETHPTLVNYMQDIA